MTWGTQSSPKASTVYPNRLGEGLQTAAESYCQQNVHIGDATVVLPALLSWYRADFGEDPEQVLFNVLHYLSPEQLSNIRALKDGGPFVILFDEEYNWQHGIAAPTTRRPSFASIRRNYQSQSYFRSEPSIVSKRSRKSYFDGSGGNSKLGALVRKRGRRPSLGDSKPGGHVRPQTSLQNTTEFVVDDGEDDDEDDNDTAEDRCLQTVVSEMTFGSDFQDLILGSDLAQVRRSRRRPAYTPQSLL
jgi:hypothetical protein